MLWFVNQSSSHCRPLWAISFKLSQFVSQSFFSGWNSRLCVAKLILWLKLEDENNFFLGWGSTYGAVQSYFESKPEKRTDQFYIFCKQSGGFREELYQPLTGSSKSLYQISGRFFIRCEEDFLISIKVTPSCHLKIIKAYCWHFPLRYKVSLSWKGAEESCFFSYHMI